MHLKHLNGESYEFSVSEAQPIENLKAAVPFILLGVVGGWLGFAIGGLLSSLFIGIGLNWFVVGWLVGFNSHPALPIHHHLRLYTRIQLKKNLRILYFLD